MFVAVKALDRTPIFFFASVCNRPCPFFTESRFDIIHIVHGKLRIHSFRLECGTSSLCKAYVGTPALPSMFQFVFRFRPFAISVAFLPRDSFRLG
jgi:hypothetical protein